MSAALFEVDNLSVRYGGILALDGVSLKVASGEVVALLGANGAGKSSLLRAVSGLVHACAGTVRLNGRDVTRMRADEIARAGLAHVSEGRGVIAPLTVEENLQLAVHAPRRTNRSDTAETLEQVYHMFPRLKERRRQPSGLLSGGEQQMLAIGRGLALNPVLLMLDEPSMGLAPIVIEEVYHALQTRAGRLADIGILLSEQSANLALGVAGRAYVLTRGRCVFDGSVHELTDNLTISAYLGTA